MRSCILRACFVLGACKGSVVFSPVTSTVILSLTQFHSAKRLKDFGQRFVPLGFSFPICKNWPPGLP